MSRLARALVGIAAIMVPLLAAREARAEEAALVVSGALPRQGGLTLAELQALGPTKATWVVEGKRRPVVGVPLERVLDRFGYAPGPMGDGVLTGTSRKGWRLVVVASAPDGFQAVLSAAELTPSMGASRALLVWSVDGKPLPPDRGPLRLVVLTDKHPSRAVWNVRRLEIVDARAATTHKAE